MRSGRSISIPRGTTSASAANVDRGRHVRTIPRVPSGASFLAARAPGDGAPSTRHRAGRAGRGAGDLLAGGPQWGPHRRTIRAACFPDVALPSASRIAGASSRRGAHRERLPFRRHCGGCSRRAGRGPHARAFRAIAHDGRRLQAYTRPLRAEARGVLTRGFPTPATLLKKQRANAVSGRRASHLPR